MKLIHTELAGEILKERKAFSEWIIESPGIVFWIFAGNLWAMCKERRTVCAV